MLVDALVAAWLGIVPGALVLLWLPRAEFDRVLQVALCTAFAPTVVSAAMAGALAFGLDPLAASWGIAIASVPLAFIAFGRSAKARIPAVRLLVLVGGIAVAVPAIWMAIFWWLEPEYRLFGRHNLMHADLIYQVIRAPWPPEEPELAGMALGYGWFGHGFNAAIGLLTDHSPTRLFPWSNLLSLSATAVLMVKATRAAGATHAAAALAAALAFLSFHTGLDPWFWFGSPEDASRLIAPITKFLFLDLMPASFPLLAVVVWGAIDGNRLARIVAAGALFALAASYVAANPAALCVVSGLALARALQAGSFSPSHFSPDLRPLALLFVAAVAALVLGMGITPSGAEAPAMMLTPAIGIREKGWDMLTGFVPWWLLALPAAVQAWRRGRPELAGLLLAGAALAVAYPLLLARNLEYKLVIYARMLIAPALGITLVGWLSSRRAWAAALLLAVATGAASIPRGLFRTEHALASGTVPLDESEFHLRWADPAEAAWIERTREETDPDTLILTRRCEVMLGALADRSLYAPCAADGRDIAGYTLWVPANLWLFRGQPRAVLGERREALARLYRVIEAEEFWREIEQIRELGRPLAIHFKASDRLKPRWLEARGLGREIHRDDQHVVWWLPAPDSVPRADLGR
jgi:hypothetical protein